MRVPLLLWMVVLLAAVAIPTVGYLRFARQQRDPSRREGIVMIILSFAVVLAIFGLINVDDRAQP